MALRDWVSTVPSAATTATTATDSPHVRAFVANVATVAAHARFETAREAWSDPGVERRRAKAIALLDEEPSLHLAVVAEAPKPGEPFGHVCTAIRGVGTGEVAIPAESYDACALLALMQQYGNA